MDVFRLIGWKIRKLRREQELNQEAFAARAELANARAVSVLENANGNPTLRSILNSAYGLGVPVSELFSTENAPAEIMSAPDYVPAPVKRTKRTRNTAKLKLKSNS
jgi:transcriptional regulator with XRE-family HTH domain